MRRLPIRARIALWSGSLTGVAIVIFAGATLLEIQHEQIEAADMELITEARVITQLLPPGGSARDVLQRGSFAQDDRWGSFGIFTAEFHFWQWGNAVPETVARAALPSGRPRTFEHDDGRWRVQAFPLGAETLVVAYDLEEFDEEIAELLFASAVSLPLAALVVGLGAWWLAGRALAPLRALTVAAAEISSSNLDRRVPRPETRDEVGHLADVFNAMLARLEQNFRQAERFAADASHELRTPLTIIRGEIEALLRRQDLPVAMEGNLVSVQEEVSRLERVTDNLLLLARFDAGKAYAHADTLDLSALVAAACDDVEIPAAAREVSVETGIAPGVRASGNSELVRRLVLNLLDNAIKFNRPGGKVSCRLAARDGWLELRIGNTGPGIPVALHPLLFDRFFRADSARTEHGHGLGLALCREIARAHGGDVVVLGTTRADWTEFLVTLPPPPVSRS